MADDQAREWETACVGWARGAPSMWLHNCGTTATLVSHPRAVGSAAVQAKESTKTLQRKFFASARETVGTRSIPCVELLPLARRQQGCGRSTAAALARFVRYTTLCSACCSCVRLWMSWSSLSAVSSMVCKRVLRMLMEQQNKNKKPLSIPARWHPRS